MRIYQSWSTKAAEVVAPGPRGKKKRMVEDQNLKEQPTPSPSQCPSSALYWQSRALLPLAKRSLQGPAAVSQSRAKKDGFEAQRQKRKKKLDNKYCGRDRHGREQRVCQAKRQRGYRPLAEKGQTGAVTLQSKFCPQPTSKENAVTK